MEGKRSQKGVRGGHNPPGHPWARPGVSCSPRSPFGLFLYFQNFKILKTDKKYFCGFFGVRLLTVSRTSYFSEFWSIPKGFLYVFLWCHGLDNIAFNINRHTWDIVFNSLSIDHLRVSTFGIINLDSSRTINLFDNIWSFPFGKKLSYKKSKTIVLQKNIFSNFEFPLLGSFDMPSFNLFFE